MNARPIEILLIDDDPVDAMLTKELLAASKLRYNVTWAKDGVDALASLRREGDHALAATPDLILLDLNMPRMDGHRFLAEVKCDPALSSIPIVVVTTSEAEDDIAESYRLHANAYITKPIGLQEMSKVVRAIEGFWLDVVRLPHDQQGG